MTSRTSLQEVTITCSPPIESSVASLREERYREARNVVVAFDGYGNGGRDRNGPLLTEDEILLFFQTMRECLPQIRQLRLQWNLMLAQFSDEPPLLPIGVLTLLLTNTNLRTLSLYRMQLTGSPLEYQDLTEAVARNTSLHTVRIEFCKSVGSPNLDCAVSAVSKLPNLKEIEVIGFPEFAARVCSSQSLQRLGACRKLECIKLWGGIYQTTTATGVDNALVGLAQGLIQTKTVKDLEIGLFQLDLDSSTALADLIRHNNTLQRIWLDSNVVIRGDTLAPLTEALKTNTSIINFNIVSTSTPVPTQRPIRQDPRIQELLLQMLETNQTMRHCDIRTGRYAVEGDGGELQVRIDLYLRLNRVGRKRLLGPGTADRTRWLQALTAERQNTSVVYYLLSRNPTFISQCASTNPRKRSARDCSTPPTAKRRRVASWPSTPQLKSEW